MVTGPSVERKIREIVRQQRRLERTMVQDFVNSIGEGNTTRFFQLIKKLEYDLCFASAMRAVARLHHVPERFQRWFLLFWLRNGDHIRQEVGNDLILMDALRVLMPSYNGTATTLYRAETAPNRKRRTYGISWSADPLVGRSLAQSILRQSAPGGSLVLKTLASPDAIICAVGPGEDRYGEQEYLVDRRRLHAVKVIERFAQIIHS